MTDLIPHDFAPDRIGVTQLSVTYGQEGDSCASNEYQTLEIKTEDAGGGAYFIIKTDRWAFDNIDSLINILNDFKKRINIGEDK